MENGRWFTLSLGRNRRADPKWLLPMICKAGDVTKRDVGSIKILDNETRFEISAEQADAFAAAVARTGGVIENGITIAASGAPSAPPKKSYKPRDEAAPYKPRDEAPRYQPRDEAPRFKPRDEAPRQPPQRDDGPRYKVRSDRGAKLDSRPAREITPPVQHEAPSAAREPVLFNRKSSEKPKANPKDKGKPKYKGRVKHEAPAAPAGAAPRKKKPQSYDPLA